MPLVCQQTNTSRNIHKIRPLSTATAVSSPANMVGSNTERSEQQRLLKKANKAKKKGGHEAHSLSSAPQHPSAKQAHTKGAHNVGEVAPNKGHSEDHRPRQSNKLKKKKKKRRQQAEREARQQAQQEPHAQLGHDADEPDDGDEEPQQEPQTSEMEEEEAPTEDQVQQEGDDVTTVTVDESYLVDGQPTEEHGDLAEHLFLPGEYERLLDIDERQRDLLDDDIDAYQGMPGDESDSRQLAAQRDSDWRKLGHEKKSLLDTASARWRERQEARAKARELANTARVERIRLSDPTAGAHETAHS